MVEGLAMFDERVPVRLAWTSVDPDPRELRVRVMRGTSFALGIVRIASFVTISLSLRPHAIRDERSVDVGRVDRHVGERVAH